MDLANYSQPLRSHLDDLPVLAAGPDCPRWYSELRGRSSDRLQHQSRQSHDQALRHALGRDLELQNREEEIGCRELFQQI